MTTYTIVAYRPNGVDTCRNCGMGTSDSAFEIEHSTSPEEAAKQWARFFMDDRKHRQDLEVSSWEVTLLIDGKSYDFADYGEPYQLVEEAARAEFGRQVEVENAAAARAAEAAAEKKRADEEAARIRKEKAEYALFIELQAKYGTPGVLVDYSFRCYSCSKEWEATTTTTDCPACGTTNNHCAANPRGVEGTKNG